MGFLSDSGYCLGGYDMQAIDKHLIRLIFISFFLFSLLPRIGQNVAYVGVFEGCLEGVWEESGGCLAHSRLCLEHINAKSIAISPVGIINLVYFIFFQWPILVFGCVVPCNTAELRWRTFPTCYDDSENCSEQPKTNEMGIHRAPIKYLTFGFLAPPNIHTTAFQSKIPKASGSPKF